MEKSGIYQLMPPKTRPSTAPEVFDHLVSAALRLGASDIHLGAAVQPNGEANIIRFRIHGVLQAVKGDVIVGIYKEVVARIKVMANLNVSDTTIPQDGQVTMNTSIGLIVLRISTVPAGEFEEVVMRVQRPDANRYNLDGFMMLAESRQKLKTLARQKSGLIVVSGPAGSGKTTLVYSLLNSVAGPDKKVLTAEDPIEVRLPYVSHTQTTHKINFASLSRSFMRQDADVIFLGEIRDGESAESAIQLAQTGHLVITTLHTRDAIGVVPRLQAFNVHPNFIASSLVGAVNMRLAQRLCEHCRVPSEPAEPAMVAMDRILQIPTNAKFFAVGPGCANCLNGISGRMPIFEMFVPDAEISDLINRGAPKLEIFENARSKGMRPLSEDALVRVYNGLVAIETVAPYVFGTDLAA